MFLWKNCQKKRIRRGIRKSAGSFFLATNQSPGLPEVLAAAYNPGMCLLALPVIILLVITSGALNTGGRLTEEDFRRTDQISCILHAYCLVGGMHGKLRQADIYRVKGDLCV